MDDVPVQLGLDALVEEEHLVVLGEALVSVVSKVDERLRSDKLLHERLHACRMQTSTVWARFEPTMTGGLGQL